METWKAINGVRVIRSFSERPLEPEHLERILNAGRRTGSSRNEQLWTFVVVRDRERLRELTAVGRYADHLAGAAAGIGLVTPEAAGIQRDSNMWDLGRAAQNMVLAAWELGIGSAPATVFDQELAHRLLGLPQDRYCLFFLSFGYPADPGELARPNRAGGRLPLGSVVREERW